MPKLWQAYNGVICDDWHPLDGISVPKRVPNHWTGPHVGKRLVEALETLRRLPLARLVQR
jgi:hypothetical protein